MSIDHGSDDTKTPNIATLVRPGESLGDQASADLCTVAFISDLHLLSSRCSYPDHRLAIRQAIESADLCVWGGDLFDFCWSCRGDGPTSRRLAIEWLDDWKREFPEKTFVYLTGNHDAQPEFQAALADWAGNAQRAYPIAQKQPTLAIEPSAVYVGLDAIRIGNCLLVHGDVIEAGGVHAGLADYRSRWQHERTGKPQPPAIRNGLYNVAVNARLHLATAGVAHRRKNVCLRLLHWMHRQPDWVGEGVHRIAFGHTHRRLSGIRIAGYEFYNGGATVKHVPFAPIVLETRV
ncbi:metallophosphoesterase [Allorhodopirellula solitaria]|uniref:Calcineurin-like phosphoesterase superfamily domain protein n=1 Tax=Allorhodopirellula solitaria TaxID=2527987 RepID=A0A5C5YGY6_9BACT|nr:metallophosphoesterase [Allorhodopirellula solitaria]TWT74253.1 Calcineurin-like phosphoesterase superfamily domain protein [Allorhodopirellula solitaria]